MKTIKNKLPLVLVFGVLFLQGCGDELTPRSISQKANQTLPLVGLDANKPTTFEIKVQAAYNDDTMFFNIQWQGNRGDTHDFLHFTNGKWRREGGHRRDAQSTLDRDRSRGRTDVVSTSYESSLAFFLDDPNGVNAVPGFEKFGCFMVCHDDSQYMPEWDGQSELTMYLPDSFPSNSPGRLDLWRHRLALANPVSWADDQSVAKKIPGQERFGGRIGDGQSKGDESPFRINKLDPNTGKPDFTLDYSKTNGLSAFPFSEIFTNPYRFFMRRDTKTVSGEPLFVMTSSDYIISEINGAYVPREGDTIPGNRLRKPTGLRGHISSVGSRFEPDSAGSLTGTITASLQRKLDTLDLSDTKLEIGGTYNIAFAVATDFSGARDHYVSFPQKLSLGNGAFADIQAGYVPGNGVVLPDFSDTSRFPQTTVSMFLPGITSYEFVTGKNEFKNYYPKGSTTPIGQIHPGSFALNSQTAGCRDCHDPLTMADLVTRRGGVNTATPMAR